MSVIKTTVIVVGGGQAGLCASQNLATEGIDHVVLERDEIASRWRTERWDSLVTNGRAWLDHLPGLTHEGDGDRFIPKEEVADYMREYVSKFDLPVREGVEVTAARRKPDGIGFIVETNKDTYECEFLIVATGPFQNPVIPNVVPNDAPVMQMHSVEYRNPEALPEGGVLVVGAGSSGAQIADELADAGRDVTIAVGPHERPPRVYRNRDFGFWFGVLGLWDSTHVHSGPNKPTISMTGARGGYTVDFRELEEKGVQLVGRAGSYKDGVLTFEDGLKEAIEGGDEYLLSVMRQADEYIEAHGLDLPEEPEAHDLGPLPQAAKEPIKEINLAEAGIGSIIWATGFSRDYSWLQVDGAVDDSGTPVHDKGVSEAHGVYYVGLPMQTRRGSSFIWGVWYDAQHVINQLALQAKYRAYSHPDD